MALYIKKGNILEERVDAIVIPTQPSLVLDGQIGIKVKEICGNRILKEIEQLKKIGIGEALAINSYNLGCKKIILVANPMWIDGKCNEENQLLNSYTSALQVADDFELESIAFPLLSTGAYKFPKRKAIKAALEAISLYLEDNESQLNVYLVIYDKDVFKSYEEEFKDYKILEGGKLHNKEDEREQMRIREMAGFGWYRPNTEKILYDGQTRILSFKERIDYLKLIYKNANGKPLTNQDFYLNVISKQSFSQYMNGTRIPRKNTIISLGINAKLKVEDIEELLATIGERLDLYSQRDYLIVEEIRRGNYYIPDINIELNKRNFDSLKWEED